MSINPTAISYAGVFVASQLGGVALGTVIVMKAKAMKEEKLRQLPVAQVWPSLMPKVQYRLTR